MFSDSNGIHVDVIDVFINDVKYKVCPMLCSTLCHVSNYCVL